MHCARHDDGQLAAAEASLCADYKLELQSPSLGQQQHQGTLTRQKQSPTSPETPHLRQSVWAPAHPSPPRRALSASSQTELPGQQFHHLRRDPPPPGRLRRQDRHRAGRHRPQRHHWQRMKVRSRAARHVLATGSPGPIEILSANNAGAKQQSSETAPTRICQCHHPQRAACSRASPSGCGR